MYLFVLGLFYLVNACGLVLYDRLYVYPEYRVFSSLKRGWCVLLYHISRARVYVNPTWKRLCSSIGVTILAAPH